MPVNDSIHWLNKIAANFYYLILVAYTDSSDLSIVNNFQQSRKSSLDLNLVARLLANQKQQLKVKVKRNVYSKPSNQEVCCIDRLLIRG